ncbi:uncharacterized mitochondrial protein AtMg00820-like [Gossypium hirsutum]|uniref:Uncharacterized mitochondrial protein AtMg00820-like n=1 Tax=Gossypium hirsutum TaxID=3635 RepID=A0ABM3A0F1_GOSHI|nr:uncharacterized mitochondrial protein AtMg00820-like [Gossypium hirsutum]
MFSHFRTKQSGREKTQFLFSRVRTSSPQTTAHAASFDMCSPAASGQHTDSVNLARVLTLANQLAIFVREPVPVNIHPMQTRSKSGIHKPKVFSSLLTDQEPVSIFEAFQSPAWTTTAQAEYNDLISNNTWDLVPLPEGRRAVGCKWIFKVKKHADGSVARYKGRLVIKGYIQEAGIDFMETFNPVVKPTTIRVVLALAVSFA